MTDTNTSASGGYVAPASSPAPLEGQGLYRFFHDVVAGITGMDPKMVTPRWFSEPANIPDAGTLWAAVGVGSRPSDTFPQIVHDGAGEGADVLQRQELLNIAVSFYDLGVEGLADQAAALFRDGLAIPQNREVMSAGGFVLAYTGDPNPAPVVLKTRWLYRVDFTFAARRQIDRVYPILNLRSANGILYAQNAVETLETPLSVSNPKP